MPFLSLSTRRAMWIAVKLLILTLAGALIAAIEASAAPSDPSSFVRSFPILAVAAASAMALLVLGAHVGIRRLRRAVEGRQELVDAAVEGIVVAKDGIIVSVNRRMVELSGRSKADLVGKRLVGDLLDTLPVHADRVGYAYRGEASLLTASGTAVPVEVARCVLAAHDGHEAYGILDLRERRATDEKLRTQNVRLDAALNNMVQGLAMFDAQRRLVVCNHRYAEIYGLTSDQVVPGTSLRQILEYRVANGCSSGKTADEMLSSILEHHLERKDVGRYTSHLSNGRTIAVSVQPMPGGGTVTTHDDITEREELHAERQRNAKILSERTARLQAIIDNFPGGVSFVDGNLRVVEANDKARKVLDFPDFLFVDGPPSLEELFRFNASRGEYGPGDVEEQVATRMAMARAQKPHVFERRRPDGSMLEVRGVPLDGGGFVTTYVDITERERNSRLLYERTSRLQAIVDNFPGGISFLDSNLCVVVCNEEFKRLLDFPEWLFTNGPPSLVDIFRFNAGRCEYGPGDVEEQVASRMAMARARQPHTFERVRPDGTVIEVRGIPLDDGGFVTIYLDVTERRRSEAKIAHMAQHDSLTGLANRLLLNERLEQALARAKRGEMMALHLLDLDRFKNVNDTLGHPAGDALLELVGGRLRALVRETDTIARMGGDEFAILQLPIAQPADAAALAHRVVEIVSQPYEIDGSQVTIGTSVGVALGPADGGSSNELVRNADLALYRAKAEGRGALRFFEADMDAQLRAQRALELDLRKALAAGEFEIHYQPTVNLESNEISGFEALLRWRHPEKGMIMPGTFIPLAEEIGLIVSLGEWVLKSACTAAADWPDNLRVAVNLSPAQFSSRGLLQMVLNALATSGLPPSRLELEITESALLEDMTATLTVLLQLRELGVSVALDDFGTGYSSLSYLQCFPFDRIKIDQSFVRNLGDAAGSLNIVRAVIALATSMGMQTTAEGVESQEQLSILKSEGCSEMQGFYVSRALPLQEIERLFLCKYPTKVRIEQAGCAGVEARLVG